MLPANDTAEAEVLGAMLQFPKSAIKTVCDLGLTGGDFHLTDYALVFDVLCVLHKRKTSIDMTTVCDAYHKMHGEPPPGTPYFLLGNANVQQLIECAENPANVAAHAHIVMQNARRRHIMEQARQAHRLARNGDLNALLAYRANMDIAKTIGEMNPATAELQAVCLADVQPLHTEWFWPGYLPLGMIKMSCVIRVNSAYDHSSQAAAQAASLSSVDGLVRSGVRHAPVACHSRL